VITTDSSEPALDVSGDEARRFVQHEASMEGKAVTAIDNTEQLDLLWGASAIRRFLGLRSNAQVYSLIYTGKLDGAVMRVGNRLCASRQALRERFAPLMSAA
jgi:hypothetical protein